MNKHDLTERPSIDDCKDFDYIAVMCGMGDDTVMLIAEMYERGIEPTELIFCDTGSEFPHTYEFIKHLQKWRAEKLNGKFTYKKTKSKVGTRFVKVKFRGWSKVVILRKLDRFDKPLSLISMCQSQNTLPSAAFGSKSCSLRFKSETADKYFNNNSDCHKAWGIEKKGVPLKTYTGKILRLVGLNADEPERVNRWRAEDKWVQAFPLYDWDIGERESEAVEKVGLYYPGKSSCTICPNMSHAEIAMLRDHYPVKFDEAIAIEADYIKHNLRDDSSTQGLGRGKTWHQKLADYDANPKKYKRLLANLPCECGR